MPREIGGVRGGAGPGKAQSSPTRGCSRFLEKQRKVGARSSPPGMARGRPAEQQAARSPRAPHQRRGPEAEPSPGGRGANTQPWVRAGVRAPGASQREGGAPRPGGPCASGEPWRSGQGLAGTPSRTASGRGAGRPCRSPRQRRGQAGGPGHPHPCRTASPRCRRGAGVRGVRNPSKPLPAPLQPPPPDPARVPEATPPQRG